MFVNVYNFVQRQAVHANAPAMQRDTHCLALSAAALTVRERTKGSEDTQRRRQTY